MHQLFPYLPWSDRTTDGGAGRRALADARTSLTHRDLTVAAQRFAQRLTGAGMRRGDVVAVMLPNRVELVVALFGAWWLGAAVTPINPTFTDAETDYQLEDSGAMALVYEDTVRFSDRLTSVGVDEVHPWTSAAVDVDQSHAESDPLFGDDLALIIYTSGSTGPPKGVLLDHANLDAMTTQMTQTFGLTPDDHCLLVLPLFHVNAIALSTLTPLRAGAQTTVLERFTPATFADAVERVRSTSFSCVPTVRRVTSTRCRSWCRLRHACGPSSAGRPPCASCWSAPRTRWASRSSRDTGSPQPRAPPGATPLRAIAGWVQWGPHCRGSASASSVTTAPGSRSASTVRARSRARPSRVPGTVEGHAGDRSRRRPSSRSGRWVPAGANSASSETQPWFPDRPIPYTVTWRKEGTSRCRGPLASTPSRLPSGSPAIRRRSVEAQRQAAEVVDGADVELSDGPPHAALEAPGR